MSGLRGVDDAGDEARWRGCGAFRFRFQAMLHDVIKPDVKMKLGTLHIIVVWIRS